MKSQLEQLIYNVELKRGEKLTLPSELVEVVGEGHWKITVQPARISGQLTRDHSAFLESFSAEDEGLYDVCPRG